MKKGEIEMNFPTIIIILMLLITIFYQDRTIRQQEALVFVAEIILENLGITVEKIEKEDDNDE